MGKADRGHRRDAGTDRRPKTRRGPDGLVRPRRGARACLQLASCPRLPRRCSRSRSQARSAARQTTAPRVPAAAASIVPNVFPGSPSPTDACTRTTRSPRSSSLAAMDVTSPPALHGQRRAFARRLTQTGATSRPVSSGSGPRPRCIPKARSAPSPRPPVPRHRTTWTEHDGLGHHRPFLRHASPSQNRCQAGQRASDRPASSSMATATCSWALILGRDDDADIISTTPASAVGTARSGSASTAALRRRPRPPARPMAPSSTANASIPSTCVTVTRSPSGRTSRTLPGQASDGVELTPDDPAPRAARGPLALRVRRSSGIPARRPYAPGSPHEPAGLADRAHTRAPHRPAQAPKPSSAASGRHPRARGHRGPPSGTPCRCGPQGTLWSRRNARRSSRRRLRLHAARPHLRTAPTTSGWSRTSAHQWHLHPATAGITAPHPRSWGRRCIGRTVVELAAPARCRSPSTIRPAPTWAWSANNEDSRYAGPHLLAMADGMGARWRRCRLPRRHRRPGHLTTGLLRRRGHRCPAFVRIALAETPNSGTASQDPSLRGMGTTLIAPCSRSRDKLVPTHIGDSRTFLVRDGWSPRSPRTTPSSRTSSTRAGSPSRRADPSAALPLVTKVLTGQPDRRPDVVAVPGDPARSLSHRLRRPHRLCRPRHHRRGPAGDRKPVDACERLVALALRAGAPTTSPWSSATSSICGSAPSPNRDVPDRRGLPPATGHLDPSWSPWPRRPPPFTKEATGSDAGSGDVELAEEGPPTRRGRALRLRHPREPPPCRPLPGSVCWVAWTQSQYWVGVDQNRVVPNRGIDQHLGPAALTHERRTDIAATARLTSIGCGRRWRGVRQPRGR